MSHSSESHGTHDLDAPMSDPSMTGDLVDRLQFRASNAHTAFYTNLADHAALDREAASLLTKQADEIDGLTRERDEAIEAENEAKDNFWAIYPEWCEIKGHGISTEAARTMLSDRIAVLEAALRPFVQAIEVNDGDTLSMHRRDDEAIWHAAGSWQTAKPVTLGDFRAARNALDASQ